MMKLIILVLCFCTGPGLRAQNVSGLQLKKADRHPMQYYISLPEGWTSSKKWPVLVVAEAAEKEFKKNAERFAAARKEMPFIIVAPFITTNGNQGWRDPTVYPYSKSTWDSIDLLTNCKFDLDGLQQIIVDVQKKYSGDAKIFLTGFEAGAHFVWTMIFKHPELLEAVAIVAGNYRSRCMDDNMFSNDASKKNLPVKNFTGSDDKNFGFGMPVYAQYESAKQLALDHGYNNISETIIMGVGHIPMPAEVMNYFATVWKMKH